MVLRSRNPRILPACATAALGEREPKNINVLRSDAAVRRVVRRDRLGPAVPILFRISIIVKDKYAGHFKPTGCRRPRRDALLGSLTAGIATALPAVAAANTPKQPLHRTINHGKQAMSTITTKDGTESITRTGAPVRCHLLARLAAELRCMDVRCYSSSSRAFASWRTIAAAWTLQPPTSGGTT